ncbi:3'-5' exonuclease [Ruegeria lacuscaerulensis]|uniref:3'-5' exonuclease n=1 Tax=Ruegeria lacuscaerulensis TaxID=55218 RepID=UPI00147F2498|nr:3'-5' exonuclease [Ruegeria lacuscaerulensis]
MSINSEQSQKVVQVFGTKEFTHSHENLYKLGGNRRNIFKKLNDIIAVVGIEGANAFKSFKTTKHGESRIRGCVKYDLGDAFRLITVQSNRIIWLLFCGSHDECDKWLNKNSGLTPALLEGEVKFTRENSAGSKPELRRDAVPSGSLLIDRLDENHLDEFLDEFSGSVSRKISILKCVADPSEIYDVSGRVEDPSLASLAQDVLLALLEDDREGAAMRLDLHFGRAKTENAWSDAEIVTIKVGSNVYDVAFGSDDYLQKINEFARNGKSLDWLLFMHPEQKTIVDRDYTGAAQLSGVSGAGKTCIALRRAIRLAGNADKPEVLIVTLNQSLAGLIKHLARLSCDEPDVLRRITVVSMFELCQRLLEELEPDRVRYYGEVSDKLGDNIDEVFREYYRQWQNNKDASVLSRLHRNLTAQGIDAEAYLREEFDWIRSALPTPDRTNYLEIERSGRRHPLSEGARKAVLEGLLGWETKMEAVGITDYLGLTKAVSKHLADLSVHYDHIIVDEAQDFGTTELAILRHLVAEGANDIFLCGDIAQHVLPKHRVLKNAGISVSGRSEKITRNYRNTRQILEVAYAVLLNNLAEEMLDTAKDDLEILDPKYANRSLNAPVLLKASSLEEELTYAVTHLREFIQKSPDSTACIVISGYKHTEVQAYADYLGLPALDGTLDPFNEPLVISDLEQTKGYEFDTVVILNCEDGILPPAGVPKDELYRFSCQLYVAMTRAKNDLYLSYHSQKSRWLSDIGDQLTEFEWSDIESLPAEQLLSKPERLPDVEWSETNENDLFGLSGHQFCFTKHAMGLSNETIDKLIELVDGKGLRAAGGRGSLKWRSVRNAIMAVESEANARRVFGPQVSKELREKFSQELGLVSTTGTTPSGARPGRRILTLNSKLL